MFLPGPIGTAPKETEAPPPPLEPLDGTYLKAPREVDKMAGDSTRKRQNWNLSVAFLSLCVLVVLLAFPCHQNE